MMKTFDLAPQDNFLEKTSNKTLSWPGVSEKEFERLKDLFTEIYQFFGAQDNFDLVLAHSHEEALAQTFHSHYHNHIFLSGKSHIITTDCITSTQRELLAQQKKLGVELSFVKKNEKGQVSLEALEACITPKTSLVSIQWSHPITGIVQPLHDIISVCQKHDIFLHVDICGCLDHLDVSLESLKIDYLTFSTLKNEKHLYPAGIIARPLTQLQALIPGYGIQKLHGGHLSLEKLQNLVDHLKDLKNQMYASLLEMPKKKKVMIAELENTFENVCVLLKNVETNPSVIVFALPFLRAEYLLYALFQKGIKLSFGGGKYPTLEHLLSFTKLEPEIVQSAVCMNIQVLSENEIKELVASMKLIVDPLLKTHKHLLKEKS